MAATIKNEIGISPKLIKSSGGVFDVAADGKLIFSKRSTGRFPDNNEMIQKLKSI